MVSTLGHILSSLYRKGYGDTLIIIYTDRCNNSTGKMQCEVRCDGSSKRDFQTGKYDSCVSRFLSDLLFSVTIWLGKKNTKNMEERFSNPHASPEGMIGN